MKDIVIIGAGGFGREVAWLIEDINSKNEEWNIIGYLDENSEVKGEILNDVEVLGGLDYLEDKQNLYYVCAIGNAKIRKEVAKRCDNYGARAATLIHPSVIMSKKYNEIGKGVIICASNIITVNTKIGDHVILNLDCTVGHDTIVNDFVTVYPSVNVSGNCIIGECVELGTGSAIIQGKEIGENSIIGAGSVVVKNISNNVTAVGIPAREIKKV